MAKKRNRVVESNPVAGGRPTYDEAPVTRIPRAPGDPTGQSQQLTDLQQGARMAQEAEMGVNPTQTQATGVPLNIRDPFAGGGGRVPIDSRVPSIGPALNMSNGLTRDDIDLLLEEINGIAPSYETAALTRRGIIPKTDLA